MPTANVIPAPFECGKLAASFAEHFGRGIDPGDSGAQKGIGKDAGQMASAAAEIVDRGVRKFGDARDQVKTGAKANIGGAKVSLRLPGSHRGQPKSYHCKPAGC